MAGCSTACMASGNPVWFCWTAFDIYLYLLVLCHFLENLIHYYDHNSIILQVFPTKIHTLIYSLAHCEIGMNTATHTKLLGTPLTPLTHCRDLFQNPFSKIKLGQKKWQNPNGGRPPPPPPPTATTTPPPQNPSRQSNHIPYPSP